MKIYDEITLEELTAPDLDAGYLYDGQRQTGTTVDRYEVMAGTVTPERPQGLRHLVRGVAVYEDCQYYHKYTADELAARAADEAARQEAEEQKAAIARIDGIDAQVTYTAMMTDTLMEEEGA